MMKKKHLKRLKRRERRKAERKLARVILKRLHCAMDVLLEMVDRMRELQKIQYPDPTSTVPRKPS